MTIKDNAFDDAAKLRIRAEAIARKKAAQITENLETFSYEEIRQILHEQQVHQIELEMQNEELLQTQQALEISRNRYFNFYDLSPVGYFTLSEKGLILEINLTAAYFLGVPKVSLVGQLLTRFIFPEDQDIYYLHRKKLIDTEAPQRFELRIVGKHDIPLWVQMESNTVRDIHDNPVIRIVMSDISERRFAVQALQQRKGELVALNQLARAVASKLSLEDVCRTAIEKVAEVLVLDAALLFILSGKELVLKASGPQPPLLPIETIPLHCLGECLCGQAALKGQTIYCRNIHNDPRCTWQECKHSGLQSFAAIPLLFDGQVLGVLGVGSMTDRDLEKSAHFLETAADHLSISIHNASMFEEACNYAAKLQQHIAERELMQQSLRQAQKAEAIGQLAGGIAHDFNNILGGILGFTELALEQVVGNPARAKASLQRVFQAGNRAKDLVAQILSFSRRDKPELTHLDMTGVVCEVLNLMKAALPANIEIHCHIEPDLPKVRADASQLHQLVMNLCTNAFQAMRGSSGVLTVSLDRREFVESTACHNRVLPIGMYVRLKVCDTGHGIDPVNLDRIFDPYFSTKEKGEGTGLGLSVSLGIVENHGGGIQVESSINKGTTFSIFLPESYCHDETKSVVCPETPTGSERILFIDDESLFIEMGMDILSGLGYHVTCEQDSLEALDRFTRSPEAFDLIITDQTMPKMTGLELVERFRQLRSEIPVIICTGFSDNIRTGDPLYNNITKILYKPYSRLDMAITIRMILKS